jgi:tRNA threonylcarbamoyladenosine modification (KEOPS) complex  Pcc1 subunit
MNAQHIVISVYDEDTDEVIHGMRIDERSPDRGRVTIEWDRQRVITATIEPLDG